MPLMRSQFGQARVDFVTGQVPGKPATLGGSVILAHPSGASNFGTVIIHAGAGGKLFISSFSTNVAGDFPALVAGRVHRPVVLTLVYSLRERPTYGPSSDSWGLSTQRYPALKEA